MRPSEAADVILSDCHLPDAGWGYITLVTTAPRSGPLWTDDGSSRQRKGLKHRGEGETRVPIPPRMVAILREHVKSFEIGLTDRLFRGARGGEFPDSEYAKVWSMARKVALSPAQCASPLARRPYDLRHAAATLWLNSGVPATEVARRLGNGVAVLLRVYANCMDGQEGPANNMIDEALGE